MTEREKQIEEMEAIIARYHCDDPISKDCYGECEYCIAKDLYDAGYRKSVPTADVVPRVEVDQLKAIIDRLEQEKAEMLVSEIAEFHIPMEIAYRLRTEHPIFIAIKVEVAREVAYQMVEKLKKRLPVISPSIFENVAKQVLGEGGERNGGC